MYKKRAHDPHLYIVDMNLWLSLMFICVYCLQKSDAYLVLEPKVLGNKLLDL